MKEREERERERERVCVQKPHRQSAMKQHVVTPILCYFHFWKKPKISVMNNLHIYHL